MKIFVTGGAGFVGRHIVEALLKSGQRVTIFDNLSNSTMKKLSPLIEIGADFVRGDITDYRSLSKKSRGHDFVIHLAAKNSVQESILHPETSNLVNVTGTLNLLKSCVENRIKNIIAASSAAVYGSPVSLPLTEKTQTIPISPYGATKLALEHYLQAFSNCYPLNAISLRFFNIYGHGQSLEYAGVIEKFMRRISKGNSLLIYGDGKNTRDFISIKDVVRSVFLAMKKIDGKKGDVYNIATGKSVTINQLAKIMVSLSNKRIKINHFKSRKGDIRHSVASIKLAKEGLGYYPTIPLREGLSELISSDR